MNFGNHRPVRWVLPRWFREQKGDTAYLHSAGFVEGALTAIVSRFLYPRYWQQSADDSASRLRAHRKGSVTAVRVSDDGFFAFTASGDSSIRKWDLQTGLRVTILEGHSSHVSSLDLSGTLLVSGSFDRTIRVWNASHSRESWKGSRLGVCEVGSTVKSVAINQSGDKCACLGSDGSIRVFFVPSLLCQRLILCADLNALSVRWIREQSGHSRIVSGNWRMGLAVWNAVDEDSDCQPHNHSAKQQPFLEFVHKMAVNVDESLLASASEMRVMVWSIREWITVWHRSSLKSFALVFHPWLPFLLAVCDESSQRIFFFDTRDNCLLCDLEKPRGKVNDLVFTPDGSQLLVGCKNGSLWLISLSNIRITEEKK